MKVRFELLVASLKDLKMYVFTSPLIHDIIIIVIIKERGRRKRRVIKDIANPKKYLWLKKHKLMLDSLK